MGEKRIWRVIFWNILATSLLMLVTLFDGGSFSSYTGGAVIPVALSERVEILMSKGSPLRGPGETELHWLEPDETLTLKRTFEAFPQCVTGFDNKLFITFHDGDSSILEDGQWVRSINAPDDFSIVDVAPLAGAVYAFGTPAQGKSLAVARLSDDGWQTPAEPFDAGEDIRFFGSTEVDGGIELLYVSGPGDVLGRVDIEKALWRHVLFDGSSWGAPESLTFPSGFFPRISSHGGRLAFVLVPVEAKTPLQVVVAGRDGLETLAEIPPPEKGRIIDAWLLTLKENSFVLLVCGGRILRVDLDGSTVSPPSLLMESGAFALMRTNIYVALLAVGALLLVSLGLAWFVMRLKAIRGRTTGGEE